MYVFLCVRVFLLVTVLCSFPLRFYLIYRKSFWVVQHTPLTTSIRYFIYIEYIYVYIYRILYVRLLRCTRLSSVRKLSSLTHPRTTVPTINHVVSASRPLFSVRSVTAFKSGARKTPGTRWWRWQWLSAAPLRASIIPGDIPHDGSPSHLHASCRFRTPVNIYTRTHTQTTTPITTVASPPQHRPTVEAPPPKSAIYFIIIYIFYTHW